MKKLVTVTEVDGEGFDALLGQRVTLYCVNYIYTGVLVGVNEDCVLLEHAGVVYETGSYGAKEWKDYQAFPGDGKWYVRRDLIESYGVMK